MKIVRILLRFVAFVVVAALVVVGLRAFNAHRFPVVAPGNGPAPADKSAYATSASIRPIEGEYLNGFHFVPDEKRHRGVVVVYGGSEGSPAYDRAEELYQDGYEVLSLFFFGQPNQAPTLANVPLDQFTEVSEYIDEHVGEGPVTVIGASKGAEFALLLAQHGFDVDNVVAFAPAHYSYSGLDFSDGMSSPSFTLHGQDIPYASFRDGNWLTGWKVGVQAMTNYPVSYREMYEQAAAAAEEKGNTAARIDLGNYTGNVVLFAGQADRMWQSEVAALEVASTSKSSEHHSYPDAGHVFFPNAGELGDGWQLMLGGTVEGNRAAHEDSERILRAKLESWHA